MLNSSCLTYGRTLTTFIISSAVLISIETCGIDVFIDELLVRVIEDNFLFIVLSLSRLLFNLLIGFPLAHFLIQRLMLASFFRLLLHLLLL